MNRTLGTLLRSIIQRNLKSWEDCLQFVEFAYIRAVHSVTHCSPFEVVHGFNPLTPMDLCPLTISKLVNVDGESKAEYEKRLHQQVRNRIEKQNSKVAERVNKG